MSKHYIMYDGRAEIDTDRASILESVGRFNQIKQAFRLWNEHDAVLVEYDCASDNTLTNERVIGHVREGYKALLAKCTANLTKHAL